MKALGAFAVALQMLLPADAAPPGNSWTKTLKDRGRRGTLSDVRQYVRGDTGKWNDHARLQHAPPIQRRPARMLLDDWAETLHKKKPPITARDDNWLLFHSRQLNDNDRVWVEKIGRNGNRFTIVAGEAVWQGRYRKNFTYHKLLGVNLGKLRPGKYEAQWIVKPLVFSRFEPSPKPLNRRLRRSLLPRKERPAGQQPAKLTLAFTVAGAGAVADTARETAPANYAYLFGESIPKKDAPQTIGINASHIEWWLGDPATNKLRRLIDPKSGRVLVRVRPVDQTIILKQDATQITLLGPDGVQLTLLKTRGPLARAGIDSGLPEITTFSFTPDGKSLVYANARESICLIDLKTRKLTITGIRHVNRAVGVRFSPDGSRIAYARYFRKDNFSTGVHRVYVARADFTGEKKLVEYADGKQLGCGFLPDGRVGVVGPHQVRAFDPGTGKGETIAGPWKQRLIYRSFGGFHPDGSSFTFDVGGPYVLRLLAFDLKTKKQTAVRQRYLESFQKMVWVRVAKPE